MWAISVNGTHLGHSEWGLSVMRNSNGSVTFPTVKAGNVYVFSLNITNCLLALLINFYVVVIILLSNELRKRRKYLMKISNASLCSLFTLLTDGFESSFYISPNQELCHASIFNLGWSNVFLMSNTLLALIDCCCWLEMNIKPKFYAQNVTSPAFVVALLSPIFNAALLIFLKFGFFLIREIGVSVALSSIRARTPFLCYNHFHQIQFLPQFVNC